MERGFYHPSQGYWQTTGEVPDFILDAYPEGTIEVPVKPSGEHEWVDGQWVLTQAPPSMPEIRAAARARVIEYADAITARITSQYPAAEVASWPTREIEARDLAANPASPAPLLRTIAAMTGEDLGRMAQAVLAKAAAYRKVVAAVEAVRTQADMALAAADTPEAVGAVLASLKARADALAKQMGLA